MGEGSTWLFKNNPAFGTKWNPRINVLLQPQTVTPLPGQTDVILPSEHVVLHVWGGTQQRLGRGVSPEEPRGGHAQNRVLKKGKVAPAEVLRQRFQTVIYWELRCPGHSVRFGWFDLWEHHRVDFVVFHLMDGALSSKMTRHLPTVHTVTQCWSLRLVLLQIPTGPWHSLTLSPRYQGLAVPSGLWATLTSRAHQTSDTRALAEAVFFVSSVLWGTSFLDQGVSASSRPRRSQSIFQFQSGSLIPSPALPHWRASSDCAWSRRTTTAQWHPSSLGPRAELAVPSKLWLPGQLGPSASSDFNSASNTTVSQLQKHVAALLSIWLRL